MTRATDTQTDENRMGCYQALAAAFSYPGPALGQRWPRWAGDEYGLMAEYDRLFRAGELWLYGAEGLAENEFQRVRILADIMGFYHAFGLEPDKDRPDALACELEFMHCLILKHRRIDSGAVPDPGGDKAEVCRQAQRQFFEEYLAPAIVRMAPEVRARSEHPFYRQAADDLLVLLETECAHLGVNPPPARPEKPAILPDQQDTCGGNCL